MSNEKDVEYQYEILAYPAYAFEHVERDGNKATAECREKVKKFHKRLAELSKDRYRIHAVKESGLGSDAIIFFERRIPTDWTKQQQNEDEWFQYRQGLGPRPKEFCKHGKWMKVKPLSAEVEAVFEFDPERDLDELLDDELL